MREEPSAELIALLDELGLATAAQVRAAGRRARALARDLPLFDSVWVDALAQLRHLTPFQAREINAGRGRALRVAEYVLREPVAQLGYATRYEARAIATRRKVWLDLVERPQVETAAVERQLTTLVEQLQRSCGEDETPAIEAAGIDGARAWAVCRSSAGTNAAEWLVRNGRFPPQVVLEIARQLAAELARLEAAGVTHGDVCAAGLVLGSEGEARLPMPGIRAIVRPEEGYTFADLQPEAYDYLAPERIDDGAPPSRAADLYACGCLWWQLLTGRPPLGGGDALSKLKAARGAKIADARRLAPETPDPLAAAIASCTRRDPARRPESMAQLAATLGPSTRAGREALAECLIRRAPRQSALVATAELMRRSRHTPVVVSAAAGSLLMLAAITWPMWRGGEGERGGRGELVVANRPLSHYPPLYLPATHDTGGQATRATHDVVLPSDRMTRAEELRFHPGQVVRPAGDRARVLVSQALRVTVEGVRFERIDFVAAMPDSMRPVEESRAMVELAAQGAEFVGCTFQPLDERGGSWAAVSWSGAAAENSTSARLNFVDCVFRGVRIGVDCRLNGALLVDFKNTLHLGAGPLCRLRRLPAVDQAMLFRLRRCTLRGAASLLDLPCREVEGEPG
jgi:hypothetical protein